VKIDRAGSIQGRVTDAATGAPLWAGVGLFTQNPGAGGGETLTDADGRYQIDGLGPYRWPLNFSSDNTYADAWTGGVVSRYASTGTQVSTGATATVDIGLTRGVAVRGTLLTDNGSLVDHGRINVLNTGTGDYAGTVDFNGNAYELHMLPGQEILFHYEADIDDRSYSSKRVALPPATPGGPPRYAVTVPAGGLTIDITVDVP